MSKPGNENQSFHLASSDFAPEPDSSLPEPSSRLAQQMETFTAATRSLETALNKERTYSKQLREYSARQGQQLRELQGNESKLQAQLTEAQKNSAETTKIREELLRYRRAWSHVLQREQEARAVIEAGVETRRKNDELEGQVRTLHESWMNEQATREQAERHAKSYQAEVQNLLVRLHTSEAKFNELSKELQALHELRKNYHMELVRIEDAARERFELALARERELVRIDVEKESAQYRERFREAERQKVREEWEEFVHESHATLAAEKDAAIARLSGSLQQSQSDLQTAQSELQKAQVDLQSLHAEVSHSQEALVLVRTRLEAMEQASAQGNELSKKIQQEMKDLLDLAHQENGDLQVEVTQLNRQKKDLEIQVQTQTQIVAHRRAETSALLETKTQQVASLRAECALTQELLKELNRETGRSIQTLSTEPATPRGDTGLARRAPLLDC